MVEYITLLIVIIILLLITIVLAQKQTTPLYGNDYEIPKFSVNIKYDEFPNTSIDVDNQFDCNVNSLRKCQLDDPTTLFGCKELSVRCQHFKDDTNFDDGDGNVTVIPKNENSNEGYALAVTLAVDSCNPYHGDLTLITSDRDSTEYMLICTCKNPGYIGNEDILGNCTTVYICGGTINNISSLNKPLNEIECVCADSETSVRFDDGMPICREMTVEEANQRFQDWTHLIPFNSDRTVSIDAFNPTVKDNMNVSDLLNPCRNSINDTTFEITNGKYDPVNGMCNLESYGIPIENGMLNYHLKATNVKNEPTLKSCDSILHTKKWTSLRFSDNIDNKRLLMSIFVEGGFEWTDDLSLSRNALVIDISGFGFKKGSQISIAPENKFYGPKCTGSWPSYSCQIAEYYVGDRKGGFPVSGNRHVPGSFLWKYQNWELAEFAIDRSLIEGLHTLMLFQNNNTDRPKAGILKLPSGRPYGITFTTDGDGSGLSMFTNSSDFNIHKQIAT